LVQVVQPFEAPFYVLVRSILNMYADCCQITLESMKKDSENYLKNRFPILEIVAEKIKNGIKCRNNLNAFTL